MVNNRVVSAYVTSLPEEGRSLKIAGGPLYALGQVQWLTHRENSVVFWTRDCRHNVQSLAWSKDDVAELIQQLAGRHYRDSEWCENGQGAWAACDAYAMKRSEWIEAARKEMTVEYFLKFAISKTGSLVLMVSCHT